MDDFIKKSKQPKDDVIGNLPGVMKSLEPAESRSIRKKKKLKLKKSK